MEEKLFTSFIGTLLQSQIQSKIYHWQVLEEGSYAAHIAVGDYYDSVGDLVDSLVESFQGRYGIVRGFKQFTPFREDNNPVPYFEGLRKYIEISRHTFTQDSYIQNQIDELTALVESTLYKLKNLR